MTFIQQHGSFKVWIRTLKGGQLEAQVRQGNRIISRHARLMDAITDAQIRHDAVWDALAEQLSESAMGAVS